jgi:alpha-mannosidase
MKLITVKTVLCDLISLTNLDVKESKNSLEIWYVVDILDSTTYTMPTQAVFYNLMSSISHSLLQDKLLKVALNTISNQANKNMVKIKKTIKYILLCHFYLFALESITLIR